MCFVLLQQKLLFRVVAGAATESLAAQMSCCVVCKSPNFSAMLCGERC